MTDAMTSGGWEIVDPTHGTRLSLYPPLLGNTCTRCTDQIDDVSFVIEGDRGEQQAGGLCVACLVEVLREFASPRS
jgi:hypothetical protein